ncbi:MAG: ACT domain-containing protein [Spirochaetes bacterium]|nr:ACT domain-containing protein [Spirochaetota bacterium]
MVDEQVANGNNTTSKRAIITVLGADKVGIIAGVTTALARLGINIIDISQTTMRNIFTMIMLVELDKAAKPIQEIIDDLENEGKKLNVEVRLQLEEIFKAMHRI